MEHREPTAQNLTGARAGIALHLAIMLALVACGTTPDMAIPRPAAAPGTASAPGATGLSRGAASPAAAAAASAPSGSAVCGPSTWATIKDHIDDPAVALVGLRDGCRLASIETTLDSSSTAVGVAICNKAAEVAYASGVSAISVTAADAREIAKGVAGSPCTREP